MTTNWQDELALQGGKAQAWQNEAQAWQNEKCRSAAAIQSDRLRLLSLLTIQPANGSTSPD